MTAGNGVLSGRAIPSVASSRGDPLDLGPLMVRRVSSLRRADSRAFASPSHGDAPPLAVPPRAASNPAPHLPVREIHERGGVAELLRSSLCPRAVKLPRSTGSACRGACAFAVAPPVGAQEP